MTTKTIDLEATSTDLDTVLALLGPEVEVVLTRGDTPLARVMTVPSPQKSAHIPNLGVGTVWMSDDFNAPLPDEFWTGEA